MGRRRRCTEGLVILLAIAGCARTASADVSTRLVYTRDRAATDCPSEEALRAAVERRLGYDPFDTAAASAVLFGVRPERRAFVVRIERTDDQGVSLGVRELRSRGEGCDALVQAAALSPQADGGVTGHAYFGTLPLFPPPSDPTVGYPYPEDLHNAINDVGMVEGFAYTLQSASLVNGRFRAAVYPREMQASAIPDGAERANGNPALTFPWVAALSGVQRQRVSL